MNEIKNFYAGEIPINLRQRVHSHIKLAPEEAVVLFLDQGVFRSARAGVVFTTRRVHRYRLFSYRVIDYAKLKKIVLPASDAALPSFRIEMLEGPGIDGGFIARAAYGEFVRLISPYVIVELEKPAAEIRVEEAQRGIFQARIDRYNEVIGGARCYLVFPEEKAKVTVQDQGLQFGPMIFFRGKAGSHFGRSFNRGIDPVSLVLTSAFSKTEEIFIPWDAIRYCVRDLPNGHEQSVKTNEPTKTEPAKPAVFIFFHNENRDRDEWLRLELFSEREYGLFLESVGNHHVSMKDPEALLRTAGGIEKKQEIA